MIVAMTSTQVVLAVISGGIVGFALGLLGGGGSILAVPLLLYVVGIHDPHVVIGSTALAVAVNAYVNLIPHWRQRNVRWREAISFAIPGAVGAFVGSILGKLAPDKELLFLFAILMIVIALVMLRRKPGTEIDSTGTAPTIRWGRVLGTGGIVGLVSGFFGIGGGFLIVPGLLFSTGMPMIAAIGSSLFSVGTFGLTTAISYAASGLVDWWVVLEFVGGGVVGGVIGTLLATRLSSQRKTLTYIFAAIIFIVAAYMLYVNASAVHL
ncbi:MAG: sulfite exporter TauE/SafE family protein [Firmicutes bacterium]|nr:sulfite exporter TauE/SafE family protein [Bacillota bacterium]